MNNCFATVYPQLADRIAAEVPSLGWIDLDQGQLDPDQDREQYPLPFHAGVVLLDFEEVDWHDIGLGVQRGDAIIRFTLAIEVVADSFQQSTQRQAALLKLKLLGDLHKALNHHFGQGFGPLVRTYSRKEAATPGLWIYSMGYKTLLTDALGYDGATHHVTGTDVAARRHTW
jgi:hypothetical protein